MLRRTLRSFDHRAPKPFDKTACGLQTLIKIERTNDSFHGIAQHIVALLRAIVARVNTEINKILATANVKERITALGGEASNEWIDVTVNIGSFPTNRKPNLVLTATTNAAATSAWVGFNAAASDPDGDPLAYEWHFTTPTLLVTNSLNQSACSNKWSTAGHYVVRCTVSDMKGGNVIILAALRAMQAAGTTTDASSSTVKRGGFGSFAHSFS